MRHIYYESENKDLNMSARYFKTANDIMDLANECADEEIINILKIGASKIFELAETHSGFIKTAQDKTGTD